MAVIQPTGTKITNIFGLSTLKTWTGLATGDTGAPVENPTFSDRSVQVGGTFGGATCTIEGSNDGVTYFPLTDPAGVAIAMTSAGLKQILQVTRYIRPNVTGGAGVILNINLLIVGK